jgi:photosystem II stability/assembly factor-like uncharacterized protein
MPFKHFFASCGTGWRTESLSVASGQTTGNSPGAIMRPILPALVIGLAMAFPAQGAEQRHPDDATLHAVQFLDPDVGYAVGDDGVILKTIDGGKRWQLLSSNVLASLRSLHMLTDLVGWVVGREELPYGGGGSVGVVLYTQDGGETWRRIMPDTVPGLNHVRFGDPDTGIMVGDSSDRYSTGAFLTTDGGRKWLPVAGPLCTSWLAADFLDGKTGALAGAWSCLGTLRDGKLGKASVEAFGGRNIHSMQIRRPKSFAVGQGGLVLESKTLGAGWDFSKTKLSQDMLAAWDFHAVSCVGDKVWIVGRPGSAVLHSPDNGATWTVCKTGQALPLNSVHFFDETRGWAVGACGCVLASTDSGRTWTVQRRGGQRAAVLCVNARAEDLPIDTVAMLAGDHGLLTAALLATGPDPRSDRSADTARGLRFAAAHRIAGGAAAEMLWQFPVSQDYSNAPKGDQLKYWDGLHGNAAAQQLLRQLVLAIRIWQPDVILTDHPDVKTTGSAASALVAEALHEAFRQAGDPKVFPEQIEELGLEPWRTSKVYSLWDKRDGSHVTLDNTREIAQLQSTAAEHAAYAARLLASTPPAIPTQRFFRLLATTSPSSEKSAGGEGLLFGVSFGQVGLCRRPLPSLEEPDPMMVAALKAQRQLIALAKNPAAGLAEAPQLLDQMGKVLGKLPDDRGAKATSAMANEFIRQGQWELARAVYIDMVKRYPLHPLSIDACLWLTRHNASGEARRRHELGQFLVVAQRDDSTPGADPKKTALENSNGVKQAGFFNDPAQLLHWRQGSMLFGKHLSGFGALYANDPSVQFCVHASQRQLGDAKEAQVFYTAFCSQFPEGPWHDAAAQELWLATGTGEPPRPVAKCRFTGAKPYLDGKFDDPCWQDQKPLVLRDAIHETANDYPTEAMLSYDEKFLYIALRCKHPHGQGLPPAKERPRDADLRAYDRVSILLDLDRDYSTYFHLQVDQRGCVCEDCWGDVRWNPQWFVAIRSEVDGWNIEAAIPLHELTGDPIAKGSAWACNVVRILPGRGIQAWSTPAGIEPRPEGMGLMMFQRDK